MKPEVTNIVRNQSSRDGKRPSLIVLHTTEGHNRPGVGDLKDLGRFFDEPGREASSHVANDSEGHDARFVSDQRKAWTCMSYNSASLNIEQIGFAATTRRGWFTEAPRQLANTAKWIAYWSAEFDIPIRRGIGIAGAVVRSGVASHAQLGVAGGGHHDPGVAYPFRYVLWLARYFKLREGHPGITSPTHPLHKQYKHAVRKVNRIRNHYGLAPVK